MRNNKKVISILLSFFVLAASLLGGPKIEASYHSSGNKSEWVKGDFLSLKAILEKEVKSIPVEQVRSDHVPGALSIPVHPHLLYFPDRVEANNVRSNQYEEISSILTLCIRRVLFPFHSHW